MIMNIKYWKGKSYNNGQKTGYTSLLKKSKVDSLVRLALLYGLSKIGYVQES